MKQNMDVLSIKHLEFNVDKRCLIVVLKYTGNLIMEIRSLIPYHQKDGWNPKKNNGITHHFQVVIRISQPSTVSTMAHQTRPTTRWWKMIADQNGPQMVTTELLLLWTSTEKYQSARASCWGFRFSRSICLADIFWSPLTSSGSSLWIPFWNGDSGCVPYIYIYIYIYVYIITCIYIYIYTCTQIHIVTIYPYILLYIYIHIHTQPYTIMYIYTYPCTYYRYTHMYITYIILYIHVLNIQHTT